MMNYNIAAGIDNSTLNRLVSEVYKSVYPTLFKSAIDVKDLGISSVGFDVNTAPTIDFVSSSLISSQIMDMLKTNQLGATSDLATKETAKMVDLVTAASFGINLNAVLTINYTAGGTPTAVQAMVKAIINIQTSTVGGQNLLTVQAVSATIATYPANPTLEDLLNKAFIPFFIPYLNKNILSPISIPTLQYQSLMVSLPVPSVQQPNLVTYAALGTTQPDIPVPSAWPSNCVFIGLDTTVLRLAASIPFPMGPRSSFDWNIISGIVEAQVQAPTNIQVNGDGSLSATIVADALAQLTLHTPWPLPNVSFGPRATASLSATFQPLVLNGAVYITIEGIPVPRFSFDWGIPSWINWLFLPLQEGLSAALNAVFGPLIGNVLKFPPIKIFSLPPMSFNLGGKQITINLSSAIPSSKNSMLILDVQASVS